MADELHAVVRLLIARMESNPEEFKKNGNRWHSIVANVLGNCSEEEKREIIAALRPIRLKEFHEEMMDELFNGEDRRREDKERARGALQAATLRSQASLAKPKKAAGI